VTLVALAIAFPWLRSRVQRQLDAPAAAMIAFGVLSCLVIGIGRASITGGLASRYITHAVFVMIGVYLLLSASVDRGDTGRWRPFL